MLFIIIIVIGLVVFFIFRSSSRTVGAVQSNHCQYFDNFQFSAQEFFALVESMIKERQVPDAKMSRVSYHQKSIFSDKREYLRIERKNDIFDICAAPFGTGFFVSYWHGEPKHRARDFAMKIPYLNTAVEGWQGTTYYQVDTANMFRLCVKDSIADAIDQVAKDKGTRGFSEAERMAFAS